MKRVLIGLAYAIGIIVVEALVVIAWFNTPLVIDFDATLVSVMNILLLPLVSAIAATKNSRDKLVEKGIITGGLLWSVMLLPICWTLPMLISKKLLAGSLLLYIALAVAGSLCSGNIRFLQSLKTENKNRQTN